MSLLNRAIQPLLTLLGELVSESSDKSSTRALNMLGGVIIGSIYIADFVINKKLNLEGTAIVAAYYGGVYTLSKKLSNSKKETTDVPSD